MCREKPAPYFHTGKKQATINDSDSYFVFLLYCCTKEVAFGSYFYTSTYSSLEKKREALLKGMSSVGNNGTAI